MSDWGFYYSRFNHPIFKDYLLAVRIFLSPNHVVHSPGLSRLVGAPRQQGTGVWGRITNEDVSNIHNCGLKLDLLRILLKLFLWAEVEIVEEIVMLFVVLFFLRLENLLVDFIVVEETSLVGTLLRKLG